MSITAGQDIEATDFIIQATAGEDLAVRDALYISSSDGKAYKCDADDVAKSVFVGFAQEATLTNNTVNIVHGGNLGGFSGFTIGGDVYLSGTAGAVTQTAPTLRKMYVGFATSASVIKIERRSATTYFTSDGTYIVPPWATMLYVDGWGGGGSGGSAANTSGSAEAGGGGGGGHRAALIPVSLLGAIVSVTVTVGQGGAAKATTGTQALPGDAGGDTTFGAFLVANGGTAGAASVANETAANGGTGGTVSGVGISLISESGQNGGNGSSVGNGSATAGGNAIEAGGGGGGAAADTSSGDSPEGAGGTSTRAGAGGAGHGTYSSGAATAVAGGLRSGGGGGAAAYQYSATSGAGRAGFLTVTAM